MKEAEAAQFNVNFKFTTGKKDGKKDTASDLRGLDWACEQWFAPFALMHPSSYRLFHLLPMFPSNHESILRYDEDAH